MAASRPDGLDHPGVIRTVRLMRGDDEPACRLCADVPVGSADGLRTGPVAMSWWRVHPG